MFLLQFGKNVFERVVDWVVYHHFVAPLQKTQMWGELFFEETPRNLESFCMSYD